jgi:2-(1,2-epoxy-1,2-dihydrophenyl)acetyl-CoA isomerase
MTSVIAETIDSVLRIELNEPDTMNALSPSLVSSLSSAMMSGIADSSVRCILLTSSGRAFCAGGDIRNMEERGPTAVRAFMQHHHAWIKATLHADKPLVTAINGVAAGAGFGLALFGDVVIAADTAKFRAAFLGLGAVPDFGLAYALPRAVGFQRASEIILTNRFVEAEEALRIGLVAQLWPAAALQQKAMETARALAAGPTVAIGLAKSLMRQSYECSLEEFFRSEAYAQSVAFNTEDFNEGVNAFQGKRVAGFRGR